MAIPRTDIINFVVTFLEKVDDLHRLGYPAELQELSYLHKVKQETPRDFAEYCKETLPDLLQHTEDWDEVRIQQADAILIANGTLSLSDMRLAANRRVARIVASGKISSISDYYYIKNLINDNGGALRPDQTAWLDELLLAFEARATAKPSILCKGPNDALSPR